MVSCRMCLYGLCSLCFLCVFGLVCFNLAAVLFSVVVVYLSWVEVCVLSF